MSNTLTYWNPSVTNITTNPTTRGDSSLIVRVSVNPTDSSGKFNSSTGVGYKARKHIVTLTEVHSNGTETWIAEEEFNASGASYNSQLSYWAHDSSYGFDTVNFDWDIGGLIGRHEDKTLRFEVHTKGGKFINHAIWGPNTQDGGNLELLTKYGEHVNKTLDVDAFWTWDANATDLQTAVNDNLTYSNIDYSDVGNRSTVRMVCQPNRANGSSNPVKITAQIVPNGGGVNDALVTQTFTNVADGDWLYVSGLEDHLAIKDYWDKDNKVFDVHLKAYTSDDVYIQGHVVQDVPLSPAKTDWVFSSVSSVNTDYDRASKVIGKAKFGSTHTSSRSSFHKGRVIVTHPSTNATKTFWFHNWDANGDLRYNSATTFTEAHDGSALSVSSLISGNETVDFNVRYDVYLPDSSWYTHHIENGSLLHQAYDWDFDGNAPTASLSEYTNDSVKCDVNFHALKPDEQNARFKILCRDATNTTDVYERWIHPTQSGGTSPGDAKNSGLTFEVQIHSAASNVSYWSTGNKQFPLSNLSLDTLLDFKVEAYDENDNLLDETPWSSNELWVPHKPQLTISNANVKSYNGDGGEIEFDWQVDFSTMMAHADRPTNIHFWLSGITIGNVSIGTTNGVHQYTGNEAATLNHLIHGMAERQGVQNQTVYGVIHESGTSGDNYGSVSDTFSVKSSFRFDAGDVVDAASIDTYNLRTSVEALVDVSKINGAYSNPAPASFQVEFRDASGKLGGGTISSAVSSSQNTTIDIGSLWDLPSNITRTSYDPAGQDGAWFDESLVDIECRLIATVGSTQVDTTAWMSVDTAGTENWNVANKWYTHDVNLTGYCLVSDPDDANHPAEDGKNILIVQTSHPQMNQNTDDFCSVIRLHIQYKDGVTWTDVQPSTHTGGDIFDGVTLLHDSSNVSNQYISGPSNHLVQTFRIDGDVNADTNPGREYRARIVMWDYRSGSLHRIDHEWNELTIQTVYNYFPAVNAQGEANLHDATHLPGSNDGSGLVPSTLVLRFIDSGSDYYNPYDPNATGTDKFSYSPRYSFQGTLTELVTNSNNASVENVLEKKQVFDNAAFTSSDWELTGNIDNGNLSGLLWESAIPTEAMYGSTIYINVRETITNDSGNWLGIYNTLKDSTDPNVSTSFFKDRNFGKAGVIMNNIANGNLGLVPQGCELVSRNGAYGLSGYTLKFQIPADLDNYYSNIEPKMIVGVRLGYTTQGAGSGHSTIVAFRDNGDEEGMGMTHLSGMPAQDVAALKLELLKSLTDANTPLVEKPDGFIHYDVDMNFIRDVWSYHSFIDISQDITVDFCFYIEEEVSSSLQGLPGNYFTPSNGSYGSVSVGAADGQWYDVDKWLRQEDVETLNLATMLTNYKYCEDDQNVGFVDSNVIDTGTITLTEYEPTKLKLVQENHQAANQNKLPFKHSAERILTTFEQTAAGSALRDPFESSKTVNQDTSFATSFSVDKDGYTVDKDVVYTATPRVSTLTLFGSKAWGAGYSGKLKIPTVGPAGGGVLTIQNNYFNTFVPDPIPPLEFVANFPEDVTGENDGTSTVNVKFIYNASEFSNTSKYFNTSHEGIKITREMIQGQDLGGGTPWSVAYDGPIFNLSDEAGPDGNKIYTFVDNNIVLQDNTPIGFDENQYYRWKYTLTPYLSYTPGGVTENTATRDSKEKEGTGLPANLPNTLPRPLNLSFRYNTKHSVMATWEYPTDGATLQFLENEGVDFKFQVFWRAVEEVDYYYENPEQESRERRDKVKDFKYFHKKEPREVSRLNNMKGWNFAGTVPYDKSQDRGGNLSSRFSFLIDYEKMSFKYGIQIAVIPKVIGEHFSFFSHDIATHASGESVVGMDQYKHPDGILVDPSDKSIRKKLLTEKERMKISDKIAKRNQDFIKHNNLEQVPISVTRKRAQINPLVDPNNEGGFNPYSAT